MMFGTKIWGEPLTFVGGMSGVRKVGVLWYDRDDKTQC